MAKLTTVSINPDTLKIIRRFCEIHGWSFARFCDKIAILLDTGIDGLTEWKIQDLKKTYPYSDVMVCQDIRNFIGFPKGSGKNE